MNPSYNALNQLLSITQYPIRDQLNQIFRTISEQDKAALNQAIEMLIAQRGNQPQPHRQPTLADFELGK